MKEGLVLVLYLGSVFASASITGTFLVLTAMDLLLAFGFLVVPTFLLRSLLGADERATLATGNVLLAVLVHPALSLTPVPPLLSTDEQFKLLELISGKDGRISHSVELAKALALDAKWVFKFDHPVMYWLYPPSAVLCAWVSGDMKN